MGIKPDITHEIGKILSKEYELSIREGPASQPQSTLPR